MKYIFTAIIITIGIWSCQPSEKNEFDQGALSQEVFDLDMQKSNIQSIIKLHKGKKIMIELWASWCADCIKSMPDVAQFQRENPEIQFIFLSVDDDEIAWKTGISKYMEKFNIKGEQYFFNTGWEKNGNNAFIEFAGLDWIPRYMLLDENGKILVYYAKKINAKAIKNNL